MIPLLEKTRRYGIKAGINVLCTLGFMSENVDPKLKEYKKYIGQDGNTIEGRLCASDERNRKYIEELYVIYAEASPDVIYIDDDISVADCFCPECMKRFSDFCHVEINREGLNQKFSDENPMIRKQFRELWMKFTSQNKSEIFERIEKAVHKVNSNIQIGAMTYMAGVDGFDTDTWAKKLYGKSGPEICYRPGGGVWNEFNPNEILEKAVKIAAQLRYLPDCVEKIPAEIENFPYQSLRKSPSFTAFEALLYLAAGCTGTAFQVCCAEGNIKDEYEPFFVMAKEFSEAGMLISNTFQREKLSGIGFWWNKKTGTDIASKEWDLNKNIPFATEIYQVGLPPAVDTDNMSVYLMNKSVAMQIPDKELIKCLSKGILMDVEALDILNCRGFGEFTGFKKDNTYTENTMEYELDHRINMKGNFKRNPRQSFWSDTVYTIEKTSEKSEYLSEIQDLNENFLGYGNGIFENSLGGRVAVEGMSPFSWYYGFPRTVKLKNLCRWLSRDTIYAYIKSFHRMSVWVRNRNVFISNGAMEDAVNAELMMHTNAKKAEIVVFKAGKIITKCMVNTEKCGEGYKLIKLPEIPIIGSALIKPIL